MKLHGTLLYGDYDFSIEIRDLKGNSDLELQFYNGYYNFSYYFESFTVFMDQLRNKKTNLFKSFFNNDLILENSIEVTSFSDYDFLDIINPIEESYPGLYKLSEENINNCFYSNTTFELSFYNDNLIEYLLTLKDMVNGEWTLNWIYNYYYLEPTEQPFNELLSLTDKDLQVIQEIDPSFSELEKNILLLSIEANNNLLDKNKAAKIIKNLI